MAKTLELKNIHKTFEAGSVNENHVLKGIDFKVNKGDFITVIGGNGAGKSTFLNSIAGSFPVDKGEILLDGVDITKDSAYKRAADISRVFQDSKMGSASRLSIEENLAIAWKRGKKRGLGRGIRKQQKDMYQSELKKLVLGLENRLKMDVGLLSGGQRQALTLLMASLVTPKLLLLDEHTAALDPKTSQMVLDLTAQIINEKNLTTLMITHNMEQAIHYGNRLIMMNNGRIVVDVSGEEKESLTVPDLLTLFKKNSGSEVSEDALLLS
ncbi:MAG: ABC transporter ATP-binding protein [Alkalibacterium sp.]|nr:ABC transporter ATP-binding protein [Alkalibacterium sp.]